MSDTSSTSNPAGSTPATGNGSGRARYVIGSDEPDLLRALAERFEETGEAVVHRLVGSGPAALVVEAAEAVVHRLRGEHGSRVYVEEDRELPEPGTVLPPGM